jgi:serine/threonine protein kinase
LRPRTDKIAAPERQAELFDLIGTTLGGKYKLERLLGVGGMGGVYAATAEGLPPLAIKVLSVADPAARQRIAGRFAREARAASMLQCQYIVRVLDAGSEEARPYLVMERLEGEDLGERLRREGRLPLEGALHVAAQVLVALGTAHEAGIVHRDLKPDNVFLVRGERDPLHCKLLDFGMSKLTPREGQTLALALTKKGMAVGTPFYMAPEQARAAPDVDGRVDVWALGAILFECLTGRPPFVGSTQEQLLIAICTTDAPDVRALQPKVPEPVAKLIARALSRDRDQRFASAWQMLGAVVDVAPAERRYLPNASGPIAAQPARGVQLVPVVQPVQPVRPPAQSVPSVRSARVATIAVAPLSADATGPNPPPMAVSAPVPASRATPQNAPASPRATRATPPSPPRSPRMLLFMLGFGALMLGIGVAVYVLSLVRTR